MSRPASLHRGARGERNVAGRDGGVELPQLFAGQPGPLDVRILKVVLAVLVAVITVATGFFVVAAVAAGYLVYLLVRWATSRFGGARTARRAAPDSAVIDVSATEVKEDNSPGAGGAAS